MIRIFIVLLLLLFYPSTIISQNLIDTILITEQRPYSHHFLKADRKSVDSSHQDITPFLQSILGGQVQISTPGGLTTLLHRGMGNRHLPILWNGLNIQSVTNGSFDLGLIPTALLDEVSFFNSGNPALQGNNGLSGSLNLHSGQNLKDQNFLKAQINSLQNYDLAYKYSHHKSKTRYSIGLQTAYHQNKFNYSLNLKEEKRQSTDFLQLNVMTHGSHQLSPSQQIDFNLWWQYADRIIPVSVTSAPIIQKQQDQNIRTQLSYIQYGHRHQWKTTAHYIKEYLDFSTPAIDSRSVVDVWMVQSAWTEKRFQKYQLAVSHRVDVAHPNFYTAQKMRNTTYLSTSRNIKWNTHHFTHLAVRQDLTDTQWMPLSWTLHHIYKTWEWSASANYNLPGFNDLYWPEGGNPDLKTEKALKTELSKKLNFGQIDWKVNLYASLVDNWIQWLPNNTGRWSPINNKKVWSRGVELEGQKHIPWNKFGFDLMASYSYNRTSAIEHYTDPDLVGKQLIFVPHHKAGFKGTVQYQNFTGNLDYQYTGVRFDLVDESSALDPIHLLNMSLMMKYAKYQIGGQVQNILNTPYQIVRFYPMPGINLGIFLKYSFQ
jgi:vitamin B12 transporter